MNAQAESDRAFQAFVDAYAQAWAPKPSRVEEVGVTQVAPTTEPHPRQHPAAIASKWR